MKQVTIGCLLLLCALFDVSACSAQGRSTIILIRHAEKQATQPDPALSEAGVTRAASLPASFRNYKPELFYSTNTTRTKQTVAAWAKAMGKDIIIYDAARQQELARALLQMQNKTIVVVGHSNTIPQLANLLTGTTQFSDMADGEYNKAYIVSVEHGHATAVAKEY
jgi:broad specificity phosphatase PhoE